VCTHGERSACRWPTAKVVSAANTALLHALRDVGVACTTSELQSNMRIVRWSWEGAIPPTYTEQRTQAIAALLRSRADGIDADAIAPEIFEAWLQERHAAAERFLYPGTIEALAAVRADHPDALIAAVTNGRGDPLRMPLLQHLFDFCVSGEDGDVHPDRKPSPRIYHRTLERAQCGRDEWAHVGDCMLNDIGASKTAGAATVWLSHGAEAAERCARGARRFQSSAVRAERERRERIEAAIRSECIDVQIGGMADLPVALRQIARGLEEGPRDADSAR